MDTSIYTFLPNLGNIKVTASGKGITSIRFVKKQINKKSFIHKKVCKNEILITAEKELRLYTQGRLKHFSVPVDISYLPEFTRLVLEKVKEIPYGNVITYRELASLIGNVKAARAVGNSLGKNPVPIIIPCHRVIRSNGSIGGFSSGVTVKKRLLALEKG